MDDQDRQRKLEARRARLESEISATADDSSSLEEEELGIDNSRSEQGAQSSQTCLKTMRNELAGKQHEIEELTEQLEEMSGTEVLKQVILSMSIAFAQQTELSRISERKENSVQSEQARGLCWQEHPFNDITSQSQVDPHNLTGSDKNVKEQFKPLSKELEEHRKEVPLSNEDDLDDDILKSKDQGLTISQEIFSKDETLIVRQCVSMTALSIAVH